MAREDSPGNKRLAAYMLLDHGADIDKEPLLHYLREKLPAYLVPTAFIILDAFPETPNGKLDYKQLPAPDPASIAQAAASTPPSTETEKELAGIWSGILQLEHVGVSDNFFDLGGHSLLAAQVVSRIRRQFNINFPLRQFFEGPTITELAGVITTSQKVMNGKNGVEG